MQRAWIAALSLVPVMALASPTAAKIPSTGNPCPAAGSTFTVTAANAALVADGFDCKSVDLVISASIVPTISTLIFDARTIQIDSGVTIDNTFDSNSDVLLTAQGGGIAVNGATIRANDRLFLECKSTLCPVTITSSTISAPINPLLTSGAVQAKANGDVSITESTFFGRNTVGVFSSAGKVTWICSSGPVGCQDPLTSGVLSSLIDQPSGQSCAARFAAGQPCLVNFANAGAVHDVCFPQGDQVVCGGGTGGCQVDAFTDVDLHGGLITCNGQFEVISKTGNIDVRDADISAKSSLAFKAFKVIDASTADLTSQTGSVSLDAKGGTGPGVPCIIVTGATISSPNELKAGGGCLIVN